MTYNRDGFIQFSEMESTVKDEQVITTLSFDEDQMATMLIALMDSVGYRNSQIEAWKGKRSKFAKTMREHHQMMYDATMKLAETFRQQFWGRIS